MTFTLEAGFFPLASLSDEDDAWRFLFFVLLDDAAPGASESLVVLLPPLFGLAFDCCLVVLRNSRNLSETLRKYDFSLQHICMRHKKSEYLSLKEELINILVVITLKKKKKTL